MKTYVEGKYADQGEEELKKAQEHVDSIFKAIADKTALPIKVDEQQAEDLKANVLGKIGALIGAGQKKATPDFADILTKTEQLTKKVTEEEVFYEAYSIAKLD